MRGGESGDRLEDSEAISKERETRLLVSLLTVRVTGKMSRGMGNTGIGLQTDY